MSFSFGSAGGGGFGSGGTGAFGSTGSAFGAAPAAGGAAASPFGGGGFGAAQPSAFGGGATGGFGSAIKPAATGFGGATTGGFGAAPATGGMFGAAQPAATGGFGAQPAGGTGLFGSGAASPGGGFGAASPTTGFGATGTTGGFGGGFGGGGATTGFGAAPTTGSAFGSNAAASPFGAPKPAAASPFGQSSGFGSTGSAFGGGGATGGFGTPAPAAGGSVFGGGAATGAGAFGAKSPSPFGAASTGGAFGAPAATTGGFGGFGASPAAAAQPAQPQVGTGVPPYEVSREQDGTGVSSFFAITRMQAYAHKSMEELRWEDYLKRTNPAQAQAVAAMNQPQAAAAVGFGAPGAAQPASSGFGSATGGFGSTSSAFGASPAASSGFGASFGSTATTATSGGFGGFNSQASTGGGMFGSTTRSLGFGTSTSTAQPTSAFGAPAAAPTMGGFGAPATGGFGSTGSSFGSAFGAPVAQAQPAAGGFGGFGTTTTGSTGGFGATTGSAFGKPATATGGFGFGTNTQQQPAQATGGFGFGANTQQPAGGSLFGSTNTAPTGSAFSFNSAAAKPATSGGFGGFGTNSTTANTGGFGTGGGFGSAGGFGTGGTGGFGAPAATPQPAGGSLFGGNTATSTGGGFGFGTNTAAPATGGGLFGSTAKPTTGLFGAAPATTGGSGLFGSSSTGGSSLFGGGATANKGSGFSFGGGGGLTGTTATGSTGFGSFGSSFGSSAGTAAPATGGFGGSLFGGASAQPAAAPAAAQPQQPTSLTAAPDVNPYGTGAFGAGLVEQNVKAALDLQSLKPNSSAASRLSNFAQDVGLPRGPMENMVASKRNLLSSNRYAIPVSFIRESGFKGTKSRFSTITSASASAASGGNALRASTSEPVTGAQDDDFKFSSSLFRNSVAKRLVINKTEQRHDFSSFRGGGSRASVIPFGEDESTATASAGASRNKALLKPDEEGYLSVVFRTLANKKSFTLRLKRTETAKYARDDVRRLLRATMSSPVSDIQLLANGRIVNDTTSIEDMNLREGDVIDVAIVEDLTDASGADRDSSSGAKKTATVGSEVSKSQPNRFMSYAEFMNSAMRDEQEQLSSEGTKPVSSACPSLKNEDYYTVPSYDRLKRMSDDELAAVEGFTVGCKGLGSVEWIGRTDVRHLDLDELIHFEKKEVIVYKDDENKHELGTGLNRPAIVELLGIFPPRKVQDPEAYKEKVKQRTRDIGSTFIDYTPSTGIWRFRVEHFSRYGFDDDDDDEDMEPSAEQVAATAGFGDPKKKMAVPKRSMLVSSSRPLVSSDRVNLVRNSAMYRSQTQFSRSAAVASFRESIDESMTEELASNSVIAPLPVQAETTSFDGDDVEAAPIVHDIPTSIVFPVSSDILNLQPLGIDGETSLLPHGSKSTTYQMFMQAANQSVVAKNQTDAGIFLSRSFRCSWGPNGELVNIGRPRTLKNFPSVGRTVTVEFPLQQRSTSRASLSSINEEALELHYECAKENADEGEGDAPVRSFSLPTDDGIIRCLHKYIEFAERVRKHHPSSRFHQRTALLWKLVQALWGQEHDVSILNSSQFCPLAARDDPREVESMETFQMVDLRREAISKWFEDALNADMGRDDDSPSEAGVLKLLCQHRIVEAAEMAMECGDFRLSTLIAQAASYEGSDFRTLLTDQLSQWHDNSTLDFIEEDVVMVYSLLAGSVEVLTARKEADTSWLMSLALFFWYKRGPATSLKTALTLYREAVAKHRAKGPCSESDRSRTKDDIFMEVMKLYVEDAVSLCSVLSPSGFPSGNGGVVAAEQQQHLDYELSWHLHSALRAIGFRIERKWESHIHQNYIRQLEGAGMWEEAVYVSLNILDATERASTCRQLLFRNGDLLRAAPAAKRVELCDKYDVPMEWLDEALAVVAVSTHQHYEEIAHWIAARQFEEAHACLVQHIAPTCLFSGEKTVLRQLLLELEPFAAQISQWGSCGANYVVGGGLVLEYMRLESQEGLDVGHEVAFLERLMQLAEQLSVARGADMESSGSGSSSTHQHQHHQRGDSELLVARTALSSMLVALSTQAVQLRALLSDKDAAAEKEIDDDDENAYEERATTSSLSKSVPFALQPEFLVSLSGLARGRETKFVESYRSSQLLSLCASFVDWRA